MMPVTEEMPALAPHSSASWMACPTRRATRCQCSMRTCQWGTTRCHGVREVY